MKRALALLAGTAVAGCGILIGNSDDDAPPAPPPAPIVDASNERAPEPPPPPDAGVDSGPDAAEDAGPPGKRAFLTSAVVTPDTTPVGFDSKCNQLAGNRGGTWIALYSLDNPATSAASRLDPNGVYHAMLPDGGAGPVVITTAQIAAGSGSTTSIHTDETGQDLGGYQNGNVYYWTGSTGNTCRDWSSIGSNDFGSVGQAGGTGVLWLRSTDLPCNTAAETHLLCLEK